MPPVTSSARSWPAPSASRRELYDWFDFMNARFELLDGDAEVLPGLSVITTPGHTVGHQCVVVSSPPAARPTC